MSNDAPLLATDHSDTPPDTPSSDTPPDTPSSDAPTETSASDAPRDNPSEPDSRDDAGADDDAVNSTVELPPVAKDANRPKHRAPTIGTVWGPRLAWAVLGTLVGLAIAKNVSEINQAPPETQMIAPLPEPEPVPTSPDADQGITDGGGTDSAGTSAGTVQGPATDFLWADGSVEPDDNPYWSQSTLTVKTTTPLTELKVVMRVAQTGGVSSTGTWSALGDKVHVVTAADSDQLSYVVTLKPGVTVEPGTYVFQFQYNNDAGGRDAGRDRYNVTATSDAATTETRNGDFF